MFETANGVVSLHMASAIEQDHVHSVDGFEPCHLSLVQLVHVVGGIVAARVGVPAGDRLACLWLQAQPTEHVRQLLVQRLQLHDVLEVALAHSAQSLL